MSALISPSGQLHWKREKNIKNMKKQQKKKWKYVVAAAAEFHNKFIQFFLPLVFQ